MTTTIADKYTVASQIRRLAEHVDDGDLDTRDTHIAAATARHLDVCAESVEENGVHRAVEEITLHLRWAKEDRAEMTPSRYNPHALPSVETVGEIRAYEASLELLQRLA